MSRSIPLLSILLVACGPGGLDATPLAAISSSDPEPLELWLDEPIPVGARYHPTRVIVSVDDFDLPSRLDGMGGPLLDRELVALRPVGRTGAGLYELPAGVDVVEAVETMRDSGRFHYVEPDYVRATSAVDDPWRDEQWNMDTMDADTAWTYSTGSGMVVAVLDTGVSSGPIDGLSSLLSGYDFVNGDSNAKDDNGHGSHVAGTINQNTNNTQGGVGLAYGASVLPVKVLDADGEGFVSDVVDGVEYAVDNGADVINMSFGETTYSASEAAAVYAAYEAGLFIAAASGNTGAYPIEYPAGYSGVVAVGATDYNNKRASYSNRSKRLDLMAPGGDKSADENGDGYPDGILQESFNPYWTFWFFEGTSQATPHVAAAAAMLMEQGANNIQAQDYLEDTAIDLGRSGFDNWNGNGLVQPADALAAWDAASSGACTVTLDSVYWLETYGYLVVWASSSDTSSWLHVSGDGTDLGSMAYKPSKGSYKKIFTLESRPDTVSLTSDCGGTDSHTF